MRGCSPKEDVPATKSPWTDGYTTANRCKKEGDVRECTCKDGDMCNSGFNVQSSVIVMSVASVAALVYARM